MFVRTFLLTITIVITAISGQAQFPNVVHYEAPPVYPAVARAVRAQGQVDVALQVDKDGKVIDALAISGHPLLRKVSELAAMKWEFSSANGVHFLTIGIIFRDPVSAKEKSGLEVLGPYRIRFTDKHYVIINTVDYSNSK